MSLNKKRRNRERLLRTVSKSLEEQQRVWNKLMMSALMFYRWMIMPLKKHERWMVWKMTFVSKTYRRKHNIINEHIKKNNVFSWRFLIMSTNIIRGEIENYIRITFHQTSILIFCVHKICIYSIFTNIESFFKSKSMTENR